MKSLIRFAFRQILLAPLVFACSVVGSEPMKNLAIVGGDRHALALRSDGTVWSWGRGDEGELGLGSSITSCISPTRISVLTNITAIGRGEWHSLAVSNGYVWSWGLNLMGEIGNGTQNNRAYQPVRALNITNAIAVAGGTFYSLAVLADGLVSTWGTNNFGQLGYGIVTNKSDPQIVPGVSNVSVAGCGAGHTVVLTSESNVWAWGNNGDGEIGLGATYSEKFYSTPRRIPTLSNVVQIAVGWYHTLALDSSGRVFAWGYNGSGRLGIGSVPWTNVPTLVPDLPPVKSIGTEGRLSAALTLDGSLYLWGTNYFSYPTNALRSPTLFSPDQKFVNLFCGNYNIWVTKADQSVWSWGIDDDGQMGNGHTAHSAFLYELDNPTFCFTPNPYPQITRFNRGDHSQTGFNAFVLPLDVQHGVELNNVGEEAYCYGKGSPWFLRVQKTTAMQAQGIQFSYPTNASGAIIATNLTTNLDRFPVANPIVAFGSQGGGDPLYTGRKYSFGAYAGAFDENSGVSDMIRILVYDRAAFASGTNNVNPLKTSYISLPYRYIGDSNIWMNFVTNGFVVTSDTDGLRTTVEFADGDTNNTPWGLSWLQTSGGAPMVEPKVNLVGYRLTHMATSTQYCYKIEVKGSVQVTNGVMAYMATNNAGWAYLPLYTLDFDDLPAWKAGLLDHPYFEGMPIPPAYAGKTVKELSGMVAGAAQVIQLPNTNLNAGSFTNINNSPELWSHPVLDKLVDDLGRDPLALASYVINEIELTDPLAYADYSQVVNASINLGGVNRSALGTYLEGQGSPTEQCALLIYLLRKAGYAAGYAFPNNNNLRLLDTTVSKLWRTQVRGVVYPWGFPVITNSLIIANYPWVVANIGTNSVHIFPWLKDTEIVEGQNLKDFLPNNYASGYAWVKDYAMGKSDLLNLAPESNLPLDIWPKFLENILATNQLNPRVSFDNIGVRAFNRRNHFPTWEHLPRPNFLTNQGSVSFVARLNDTNSFPFLTNAFDRIRVEVYKSDFSAGNQLLTTGDWYACDWHNRKMLLYTNTLGSLTLWLAPYYAGVAGTSNFMGPFTDNYHATNCQMLTTNTDATNLRIRLLHWRKAASQNNLYSYFQPFYESVYSLTNTSGGYDTSCLKGDVAAICFDPGRVSQAMVRQHAEEFWRIKSQIATNANYVPTIPDSLGTAAMLMGMGYFEKCGRFRTLAGPFYKIENLFRFDAGLAALRPSGSTNVYPFVDMVGRYDVFLGNASLRPDSGNSFYLGAKDYRELLLGNESAQEHDIINVTFGKRDAISTVRLLQIAANVAATNANFAPPLELNSKNFARFGDVVPQGWGTNHLKDIDPSIWQSVINAFTSYESNYMRVLITPGLIANETGSYTGMGALITAGAGNSPSSSLISGNRAVLKGGFGEETLFEIPRMTIKAQPNGGYRIDLIDSDGTTTPYYAATPNEAVDIQLGLHSYIQSTLYGQVASYAPPVSSLGGTALDIANRGYLGLTDWLESKATFLADPVNAITGEFYVDTADLTLPGPFPLEFRRNYLSRNLSWNQLGVGWKMNFMPYLYHSLTASGLDLLYAAEMDGSVIAYRSQSNDTWTVYPADNPTLDNNANAGIGSVANMFNGRIERYTTNGVLYVLKAPDGSKRFYEEKASFAFLSQGTNFDRVRPYLTRWEDHAGNYHLFTYGTDSAANDYGQIKRIESANGNFISLQYDQYGRILEALSGDGRRVQYEYDDYGDLIRVTLPDASEWRYEYEHYQGVTNGATYTDSTHLLTKEYKPNGRILANSYDQYRRVITQAATVGADHQLVTNAFFTYNNGCTGLDSQIFSGSTTVEDVFHHPTTYYYANNLIVRIVDALGRTTWQEWFTDTNSPGAYPRSLKYSTDPRGLTNEYRYDPLGNLTQLTLRGTNISGDGLGLESASMFFTYTNGFLPLTITNFSDNVIRFYYEDAADPCRLTKRTRSKNGTINSIENYAYTGVTQRVDMGGWFKTNIARGLRWQTMRGNVCKTETAFDGRGYPVAVTNYAQTTDYPANTDPAVIGFFAYNARGQLYQQADVLGRTVVMDYDAMGRKKWREVQDESGNSLAREYFYYNRNGELEWYDGPRSNPDDLVWYNYDGAGRKIKEAHWRTRAMADGAGVEAVPGDDLYAVTQWNYDAFGNLTSTVDPRGNITANTWDAMGQLMTRQVLDANSNVLATESFGYEPGGQPSFETNALGGVTEKLYTSTGKPCYQKNPDGSTNAWRYYLDGRLRKEILANGNYWESVYDDVNRKVTRSFKTSDTGTVLATTVSEFDLRGNLIKRTDALGNVFTNAYDGLERLKIEAGPAVQTLALDGNNNVITRSVQQVTTHTYDASGKTNIVANALGEKTITTTDGLGRVVSVETRDAGNNLVHVTTTAYSSDHHSVTVTNGSGPSAIVSTTFTDTLGKELLSIGYPANGVQEFTLSKYDAAGNRLYNGRYSSTNGKPTLWTSGTYSYDGLNRLQTETVKDGVTTAYYRDAAGNITNRAMPGGLSWRATYDNAGRLLTERNVGTNGASALEGRGLTNTYYVAPSPLVGKLYTVADGRGVNKTYSYDSFLRLANVAADGPANEQKLTLSFGYDLLGRNTSVTQAFANLATGPTTIVQRGFDPYGLLSDETVQVGGTNLYSVSQGWDTTRRRACLSLNAQKQSVNYGFAWRADGLLSAVASTLGAASYIYDDGGHLNNRTVGARSTTLAAREGVGRPLQINTTVNGSLQLTELLAYTGDGLLASHLLGRTNDFTDVRSYDYASQSRRLVGERVGLASSNLWTNQFTYDGGQAGSLGVLTRAGSSNSSQANWTSGTDLLGRLNTGTNNVIRRSAYGTVNGPATVTGTLDGRAVPIVLAGTNGGQWSATLDVSPGAHQLIVQAQHPSQQYTQSATNGFSNASTGDRIVHGFDATGQLISRAWKSNSVIVRTQSLTWDAFNRLLKVSERDTNNSGYDWSAVYDGLNRRLQTQTVPVSNNVAFPSQTATLSQYFDPQVEFLELGASANGQVTWKLYGPDLNGVYGGLQGVGGLEGMREGQVFSPILADARGNFLGLATNGTVQWSAARPTGYGSVPGYNPSAFSANVSLSLASSWRGKWSDPTGLYWVGLRYYDPISGSFISADPLGHEASLSLYGFCNGDPINGFDPDGRYGKNWALDTYDRAKATYYGLTDPNTREQTLVDLGYGSSKTTFNWTLDTAQQVVNLTQGNFLGNPITDTGFNLFRQQGNSFFSAYAWEYGVHENSAAAKTGGTLAEAGLTLGSVFIGGEAKVASMLETRGIPTLSRLEPFAAEGGGYGVSFFDSKIANVLDNPGATLGRSGEPHFFMPLEDAASIRTASDAARQTGMAPSVARAYTSGTPVYGVSFPTEGLGVRVPTAADANGWAHFLEGGRTAVATEGANGGYLLNSTREFVVPGGGAMPQGSVLFRLEPNGAWTIIRRY